MEIQLSKAPRIFFDQDKWAEYVAHFDTEEIALMHLSSPPGIDFSWWKDPMKPDEAVRVRKEELFKHKMDLIQAFYKRLENNSIIASGRSLLSQTADRSNSPQRMPIPPERRRDLWPALIGDKLGSGLGGALSAPLRPANFQCDVAPLDPTEFAQFSHKSSGPWAVAVPVL
jgi:hypothetical protein